MLRGDLQTGPGTFPVNTDDEALVSVEVPTLLEFIEESGNVLSIGIANPGRPFRFRAKEAGNISVTPNVDNAHWGWDVREVRAKLDPIPFEVPEEMLAPETLQEKLMRMVDGYVRNLVGHGEEYETFEEAMDFDLDNDGDIGGYEFTPMVEQEPITPPPAPPPEPSAAPEPVPAPDPGVS